MTSFFRNAKRALAAIQGRGGIWFAGNNTTMDSQEGALVSAMISASVISSWRYPFSRWSTAYLLYRHLRQIALGARKEIASRSSPSGYDAKPHRSGV